MNTLKNTAERTKGTVAFVLVVFLLFAGISKSVAAPKSGQYKKVSQSVQLLKADENTAVDDARFNDADNDSGFEFLPVSALNYAVFYECKTIVQLHVPVVYTSAVALPLYDLFCNWKHCLN